MAYISRPSVVSVIAFANNVTLTCDVLSVCDGHGIVECVKYV